MATLRVPTLSPPPPGSRTGSISAVRETSSPRTPPPALRLLVGEARGAVIAALAEPRTSSGLAAAVSISPSTASEHLDVLRRCGILNRARQGRYVYYELNARGTALVELLNETEADQPRH